jgi:hypothetical protein
MGFVDYQNYPYKHIYYLHGALFMFSGYNRELKITRTGNFELIERIATSIRDGKIPLFVSEGTSREKLRVIRHNAYLNFALTKLRKCREQLVIYGASLADQDAHILELINEERHRIAISVYVGDKTEDQLDAEMQEYRLRLRRDMHNRHEINFFNSTTLFQYQPM